MKKGLGRGLSSLLSAFEDEGEDLAYDLDNDVKEEKVVKPKKNAQSQIKKENAVNETKLDAGVDSVDNSNIETNINKASVGDLSKFDGKMVIELDIEDVIPNVNQPRKQFNETALKELADSIKIHGVIQPIVVNRQEDGKYMIVAGERRWRASKLARRKSIPAIIENFTDKQVAEVSLIENLQREDLNPIEEARAIKKLMQEYGFTQETVADRIGKSRSVIANTLRLLNLYPEVIKMVENNELSVGHAKCLVVVDDVNMQLKFANSAKNNKMTVRDLEKAVKEYLNPKQKVVKTQSLELREMVSEMSKLFSTKVSILGNDNKGRIFIDYYTKDDLDRIFELLELAKEKTLTLKDLQNINLRNKK